MYIWAQKGAVCVDNDTHCELLEQCAEPQDAANYKKICAKVLPIQQKIGSKFHVVQKNLQNFGGVGREGVEGPSLLIGV